MLGKASIQIGNVNDKDKQKVSMTYYLGPFNSVQEAQSAKLAMDNVAEAYGADISSEAKIIGEELHEAAEKDAAAKTAEAEEK